LQKVVTEITANFSIFSKVFADIGASVEVGVVDPAFSHIVGVDESGVLGQVVLSVGSQVLAQSGVVGSVYFLSHSVRQSKSDSKMG